MAIDHKKTKTSLYLDSQLVQSTKMIALNRGKHEYEVIEEALREYISSRRTETLKHASTILDEVAEWQKQYGVTPLSDDAAMQIAVDAVHEVRAELWAKENHPVQKRKKLA